MTKNDSVLAMSFDEAIRDRKFEDGLSLEAIEKWVGIWCYDNMDDSEYSEESISADAKDLYGMVFHDGKIADEYAQFVRNPELTNKIELFKELLNELQNQFSIENARLFEDQGLVYVSYDIMADDKDLASDSVKFACSWLDKQLSESFDDINISEEGCDGEPFWTVELFA